jgi:hypothetical protein
MMTNEELLEKWKVGYSWLTKHEQVTNTNKNSLGEIYDHALYLVALKRIETLEDEMKRRGMEYGKD